MIKSPQDILNQTNYYSNTSGGNDKLCFSDKQVTRKQHASHYQNTRNNPDCSLTFCVFHSKKHLGSVTPSHEETKGHKPDLLNFHEKNYSRNQQVLARDMSSQSWFKMLKYTVDSKKGVQSVQLKKTNKRLFWRHLATKVPTLSKIPVAQTMPDKIISPVETGILKAFTRQMHTFAWI